MESVWILWGDSTEPTQYSFSTLTELNAFLKGIEACNSNLLSESGQWEQFDTHEEWQEKYNNKVD